MNTKPADRLSLLAHAARLFNDAVAASTDSTRYSEVPTLLDAYHAAVALAELETVTAEADTADLPF